MGLFRFFQFFFLTFAFVSVVQSSNYTFDVVNGTNMAWFPTLSSLLPGDVISFLPGTYSLTSKVSVTFTGTSFAPILIQGVGEGVIFNRPNQDQNIWDIDGSYFTINNIQFSGGSKGLRFGQFVGVSYASITNVKVYSTADTAISCNQGGFTYSNITFSGCEVYNTGNDDSECFYLGCENAGCIFQHGIITHNLCHDTLGATAGSMGSGVQVKTGSFNNVISNNVFYNTKGPCILIYDDYGNGINVVEGNVCFSPEDNGIQLTAGAKIVNNIVISPAFSGIAITDNNPQPSAVPRNVQILHNTILNAQSGGCIYVTPSMDTSSLTIANNALFCSSQNNAMSSGSLSSSTILNNGYIGGSPPTAQTGGFFQIQDETVETDSPSSDNFYPQKTSSLILAGDPSHSDPLDFSCLPRNHTKPTVGAYEYFGTTNPGWAVTTDFKVGCSQGNPGNGNGGNTGATSGTTGTSSGNREGVRSFTILAFVVVFIALMLLSSS